MDGFIDLQRGLVEVAQTRPDRAADDQRPMGLKLDQRSVFLMGIRSEYRCFVEDGANRAMVEHHHQGASRKPHEKGVTPTIPTYALQPSDRNSVDVQRLSHTHRPGSTLDGSHRDGGGHHHGQNLGAFPGSGNGRGQGFFFARNVHTTPAVSRHSCARKRSFGVEPLPYQHATPTPAPWADVHVRHMTTNGRGPCRGVHECE